MKYLFLFVIRKFKKLFKVSKYRVEYQRPYHYVQGYKLGHWWDCWIAGDGYMRFLDNREGIAEALKFAKMMEKQNMGLHYYSDEYRKEYRVEIHIL